jgi:signal transduction histidine kinase
LNRPTKGPAVSYGGTGLGAQLLKQLVELQGGLIIAQSEIEKVLALVYYEF